MRDASDYYKTERCFYPTSPNLMLTQSLDRLTSFDAFAYLDTFFLVRCSLSSEASPTHATSRRTLLAARQSPRKYSWSKGAKHVDLYDGPQ